jgi:hypothetical protein
LPTSISLVCTHHQLNAASRFAETLQKPSHVHAARANLSTLCLRPIVYVRGGDTRADQAATELKGRGTKENTFSVEMRSLCHNEKKALCGTCGSFLQLLFFIPALFSEKPNSYTCKQKEERGSIKGCKWTLLLRKGDLHCFLNCEQYLYCWTVDTVH